MGLLYLRLYIPKQATWPFDFALLGTQNHMRPKAGIKEK
jgi:hypothetical protein